jgi:class 3 adenylate cyclase
MFMKVDAPTIAAESLLPWRVVAHLDDGVAGAGARARRLGGAVLVADISGYTRITQALCEQGDEGLGQLSDLLTREFSRYLDVVARHDGEIVSFAGDALIACFLSSPAEPAPPLERARACAAALAALSGSAPAETANHRVTLHLGIAYGPIWMARLGGWYQRWELLLGGAAVRRAFAAASAAAPGQVTVAEPIAGVPADLPFPHRVPTSVLDDSWWWGLVSPRLVDEARGQRRLQPELRQVCALFVRVKGLDEDSPDAVDRHQELVFAVHETLRAISTASGRFLIDERGLLFVLVLGDPGNAHADDLERALSFAKTLEARARGLGLTLAMGFATGRAFCGVLGNDVRRQVVAISPAMNLAARLMDATSDGLTVALPLPADRLHGFTLAPARTVQLKGIGEPVAIAHVETQTAAAEAPIELHGRRGETERLARLLEAARAGKGGLALIVGEAGMGKSTLLAWFRRQAAAKGMRCVLGEGDLTEAASSYFAFRPIVRALLGAAPDDGVDVLRARLLAWLATAGKSEGLAPLFNSLLPLQLPETPTTTQLRGPTRAEVLVDLLVELVRRASDEPVVILIEDAHWIDSASALLIEQIAARLERQLVLLTARPEAEETALEALRGRSLALRLELAPLDTEAVGHLAESACGGPVEPAVVALVREQTAGNPLFAREYMRALRESGRLARAEAAWELADRDANLATAPPTLQGLIASRIDGLSGEAQAVLRIAAVIGQQIDRALLEDVTSRSETADLSAALASLSRRQLVVGEAGDRQVRFAHALIQSVAYDSLLFETRKQLHRAVAQAIERRPSREPSQHVLLVHHWSRARDQVQTTSHAELAAEEAVQLGAYREARSFARLCIEQADGDPALATPRRRTRWQLTLADASAGLGDLDGRRAHATNALTLNHHRLPRTAVTALMTGAAVLAGRGLHRLALRALKRSADATPSSASGRRGAADDLTRAYRQLAVVSFFANEPLQILCYAAKALVNAERVGPGPDLCGALAEIGAWFGFAGFEPLARPFFTQAFSLAEALADRPAAAHVNMVHSLYSVGRGEWERVRLALDRCQTLCLEVGDRLEWGNAQIVRFWRHHYRGERASAAAEGARLLEVAQESGNIQQQSWALHALGLGRLEERAIPEALDLLTRSAALIAGRRDRTAELSTSGSLALAYARSGDTPRALDLAHRTIGDVWAIRRPMGHAMLEGLSALAEVALSALAATPRSPSIAADARTAVALLRRQAGVFPIAVPRYRYWQARLREMSGRNPARVLRSGLVAATALGMPTEVARLSVGGSTRPGPGEARNAF